MAVMDQKENTERCELKVAQKLLAALPALDGKTVTAEAAAYGTNGGRPMGEPDPLHCQKETARIIIEKGGEYFLQIKGNQPALLKIAQRTASASPLLSRPTAGTGESKSAP